MVRIPRAVRGPEDQLPPPRVAEFYTLFCPCCGMAHAPQRGGGWGAKRPSETHLGCAFVTGERGRLQFAGYFDVQDDPCGAYGIVKARFLEALRDWHQKGWISKEEALEQLGPG